jgi:hypothetical protein
MQNVYNYFDCKEKRQFFAENWRLKMLSADCNIDPCNQIDSNKIQVKTDQGSML